MAKPLTHEQKSRQKLFRTLRDTFSDIDHAHEEREALGFSPPPDFRIRGFDFTFRGSIKDLDHLISSTLYNDPNFTDGSLKLTPMQRLDVLLNFAESINHNVDPESALNSVPFDILHVAMARAPLRFLPGQQEEVIDRLAQTMRTLGRQVTKATPSLQSAFLMDGIAKMNVIIGSVPCPSLFAEVGCETLQSFWQEYAGLLLLRMQSHIQAQKALTSDFYEQSNTVPALQKELTHTLSFVLDAHEAASLYSNVFPAHVIAEAFVDISTRIESISPVLSVDADVLAALHSKKKGALSEIAFERLEERIEDLFKANNLSDAKTCLGYIARAHVGVVASDTAELEELRDRLRQFVAKQQRRLSPPKPKTVAPKLAIEETTAKRHSPNRHPKRTNAGLPTGPMAERSSKGKLAQD